MDKINISIVIIFTAIFSLFLIFPCQAEITTTKISEEVAKEFKGVYSESWLANFNKNRDEFSAKYGTSYAFVLNYVQQAIIQDEQYAGHSAGLWYANLAVTQKLWPGAMATAEFEVDKNKGVDKIIPTYALFDSNTGANASLYVPSLYIEQNAFSDKLYWVAGKTDLSNWFDTSQAASSADIQFLSSALINSYTIPFPQKGPVVMAQFKPNDKFYYQAGAASADAVSTKIGLNDAFASTLFLNEFGVSPEIKGLQGNYRFIFYWLRKRAQTIMDDTQDKKNETGFSLSFDQAVTEKIILFLRYGISNPKLNDIEYAWSCGFQVNKPFKRKNDYYGLGVAQSIFGRDFRHWSNDYNEEPLASRETIVEAYYNFSINDYIFLSPDLQAVFNPEGERGVENPIVASIRMLVVF